jgi:farnesyl-diphosphate farnesyltransferase
MSTLAPDAAAYCRSILPHVSRTFALTIPVLREPLRIQVAVSYLLCRIADTVEDRDDIDPCTRERLFLELERMILAPESEAFRERFAAAWPRLDDAHHEDLVQNAGQVLECYRGFPPAIREAIAACLSEMVAGMRGYAAAGAAGEPAQICHDLEDLERYCHFVAGTVGILLSRLFAGELPSGWLDSTRIEDGRRFGLGLQLTNILKDLGSDRGRGVSFVPESWVDAAGASATLGAAGKARLIPRALDHLEAGHRYILAIPSGREDMRIFCLWAAHLALATLERAAAGTGAGPVKVSRPQLWTVLERARDAAGDDVALETLHREYTSAVRAALG